MLDPLRGLRVKLDEIAAPVERAKVVYVVDLLDSIRWLDDVARLSACADGATKVDQIGVIQTGYLSTRDFGATLSDDGSLAAREAEHLSSSIAALAHNLLSDRSAGRKRRRRAIRGLRRR